MLFLAFFPFFSFSILIKIAKLIVLMTTVITGIAIFIINHIITALPIVIIENLIDIFFIVVVDAAIKVISFKKSKEINVSPSKMSKEINTLLIKKK